MHDVVARHNGIKAVEVMYYLADHVIELAAAAAAAVATSQATIRLSDAVQWWANFTEK